MIVKIRADRAVPDESLVRRSLQILRTGGERQIDGENARVGGHIVEEQMGGGAAIGTHFHDFRGLKKMEELCENVAFQWGGASIHPRGTVKHNFFIDGKGAHEIPEIHNGRTGPGPHVRKCRTDDPARGGGATDEKRA